MSNNKLPASDKLKVAIRKYVGYSETEVYEAIQDYTNEVVKYTLEQAADKAEITYTEEKTWDFTEVDKQSILSLESQIIKDLGL